MTKSYRDLLVWQQGIVLVKEVYTLTKQFPKDEIYGLMSQIRRSAVSVPSNIAEGQARNSDNEFRRFLLIALGSLAELDTQIEISSLLGYLEESDTTQVQEKVIELRRMLFGLINSLSQKDQPTI